MPRRVLESLERLRLHLSLKTLDMEIPPETMGGLPGLEIWTEVTSDELKEHIDTIEEAYEFFLAYAAQGVSGSGAAISGELSRYLSRADQALTAFESGIGDAAEGQDTEAVARMDQLAQCMRIGRQLAEAATEGVDEQNHQCTPQAIVDRP